MERKPRKRIEDMIEELRSWLPNYDHKDYPTFLFRILASMPGGDELEGMGYETFNLGGHEMDQLARVLDAIQDKYDVEDLAHGLTYEEEEDVGEARGGRTREAARPAQVHSALRTRETPRRPATKPRARKAPAKKTQRRAPRARRRR